MNFFERLSRLGMNFVPAFCIFGAGLLLAVTSAAATTDVPPAAPVGESVPPTPPPKKIFAGDRFLGLENGSFVESVYFYHVWKKLHPDEAALVLITSPQADKDGKNPPVTAVTLYTNNGKVLAHTIDYGKVRLNHLGPDELQKDPAHCLDEYLKTVAKLPLKPVPAVGSPEEQIQHAFTALHDPKKLPSVSVVIADSDSAGKSLVFAWNDARYAWQPTTGALLVSPKT